MLRILTKIFLFEFSDEIFVLIFINLLLTVFLLTMNSFLSKSEIICQILCCTSEQVLFHKLKNVDELMFKI